MNKLSVLLTPPQVLAVATGTQLFSAEYQRAADFLTQTVDIVEVELDVAGVYRSETTTVPVDLIKAAQ